ncbi:MAG: hypothetical protein DRJ05_04110 [Bacteroidetes bacterium]|nr:MAG: hypothetical protein DRJ05_04110 [Bacteroidota bacterium]
MIKVYLDWNVMAQMKGGYQNDLLKALSKKDKFFIPYSTSHIGDILSSYSEDIEQKKRINEDLEFITSLTGNHCLSNNGKQVSLNISDPKALFQQRVDGKDFMTGFSLDLLDEILNENELTKGIGKSLVSLLKSIPIDGAFIDAIENPESGKYLNQMLPELKENPTMEGFFKSFGKMYQNFNEKEDYKILREVTQKGLGIKRDKIFNDDNPYSIIDKAHNKLGVSLDKYIDNSKNAPEWFNKISNEYIMLDMHGYQEDTVKVKENKRKETFRNTTEDSFHSAFASTCNFYIINDKKSYKKTKQIYERLKINTVVFKPDEFLDYFQKYLNIEHTAEHFKIAFELIKTNNFFESKDENGVQRFYIFPYFLFDFFNKIVVVQSNENEKPIILLSKFTPTNGNATHFLEIKILVKMLNEFFGNDIENKGDVLDKELETENWAGRIWKLDDIQFKLMALNGYFQLYLDI